MLREQFAQGITIMSLAAWLLTGCNYHYEPPYNDFKPYNRSIKDATTGGIPGAAIGTTIALMTTTTPLVGTAIGAAVGVGYGLRKGSRAMLLEELKREDIEYIEYGDTKTLVVPTDRYYKFNTPRFNELCYIGLSHIVKLLQQYPDSTIYVAGFTDAVGSRYHKNMLSQAQAETMLTFLWANGIQAHRLNAEGYGDKYSVSQNVLIHGSAQNRRLEIQWMRVPCVEPVAMTK